MAAPGTPVTAAQKRSVALLESCLDETQAKTWAEERRFCVKGSQSGDVYCIAQGWSWNVQNLRTGEQYGIQIGHHVMPLWDHLCGQLLLLRHDEEHFLDYVRNHGNREFDVPVS